MTNSQQKSLKSALNSDEFTRTAYKLPIVLGYDDHGNLLLDDLSTAPHILMGGGAGSGKSVFIQNIITSLTSKLSFDEVKFALFDLKMVELEYAKALPHLFDKVVLEWDEAVKMLKKLVDTMNERIMAMKNAGLVVDFDGDCSRSLDEYNLKTGAKTPHLVVVFDEYSELQTETNKEVEKMVLALLERGHIAGIHLVIASQRTSDSIFTPDLQASVSARAAFRTIEMSDRVLILGDQVDENLQLHTGEVMYSSVATGKKPKKINIPYGMPYGSETNQPKAYYLKRF